MQADAPAAPSGGRSDDRVVTSIDAAPMTHLHPVPDLADRIYNPGLPRANITCDAEHPAGTYSPPAAMTVMQQHIAFWDRDNDGMLWPSDTYVGFRKLGFNVFLSAIAVPIIHGTFSWWTQNSWLPDPAFRIRMGNIHRGKHGSDSETYDTEGRFVPQKFEELFSKYDKGNKGGLSFQDVQDMVRGNRNIMDPTGWIAGWLEWNVSYYMAAKDTPRGRLLLKDDVRRIIDGTIFYAVAREVEAGRLRMRQLQGGMEPRKPVAATPAGAAARKID
ncbi:caleosin CLO3-2 isoform B [Micractinium conductrix]|uniref:Caleosin CLO3-2 isoform B n=1 Tax=Micractinium conductrix TaxID=554055 RepID=A0A2P6VI39_9CHLO|nr:caleosin CLO3-2 isoform B [Micractinium conductrix]|eukprot:PSC73727.1 caleosin CLO3-2 isoform B [Micractinium conductrix]